MRPGEDNKPLAFVDKPHPHDVLCGRGGRTNLHKGNIWFRRLVRSNRALYKTCPKHTKLLVAKAVVKAVQGQDPPGRYLEADKATGGWKEIPYKRALDKTSQALRERDPNPAPDNNGFSATAREAAASATKNTSLEGLTKATLAQAGLLDDLRQSSSLQTEPITKPAPTKKRKEPEQFQKPAWWNQGTPIPTATQPNVNTMGGPEPIMKRQKAEPREDEAPLPLDALQTRQSSFFNFLSGTGVFGSNKVAQPQANMMYGNPSGMQMNNNSQQAFDHMDMGGNNNRNSFAFQQQQQQMSYNNSGGGNDQAAMMQPPKMREMNSLVNVFDPLPIGSAQGGGGGNFASNNNSQRSNSMTMNQMQVREQMQMIQRNNFNSRRDSAASASVGMPPGVNFAASANMPASNNGSAAAPPKAGLTTQVSDWLTSFFPPAGEEEGAPPPPPGSGNLDRSISSTLFNMARSPSQFLTSLKSGVTSMFMESEANNDPNMPMPAPPGGGLVQNRSFGTRSNSVKDSLLDDTEDDPLETQLRQFPSR